MSLIAYSEFVTRVRKNVWPDVDNDGVESHLEPTQLRFPHSTYIQNALITAQTYVECLRQNNVQTYTLDDATVNCGVAVFTNLDHARVGAVYAYKPNRGCKRLHFTQQSVNKIMCYVDGFASCKCKDEGDICNAVRSGNAVCDNLELCAEWDGEEDDSAFKCDDRIFAVGASGRLYVAPRIPCGYRLAVHWEGIKYRYADADLISDDPDLLDLISTYVQAERARTFDRDLQLYHELLGKGPARNGKDGSAFHTKQAAMAHRCKEERRIRTRPCLEMWDDSAVSSENIGAQLDPVPARDDAGIEFERCDGCPEGQVKLDGVCTDCQTPIVSISASDTTLVPGQSVTITFGSSNIVALDSSTVTLEADGVNVALTANESGSVSFTPTASTTYTVRANTACGDAAVSVAVTVSEDAGCPCPLNVPDCLRIVGFDDTTFAHQAALDDLTQTSLINVTAPISDLSGLTFSAKTNTVFSIRNQNSGNSEIDEYDHNGALLRTIVLTNFTDTEGVCWMYGDTFVIAEENPSNRLTIVTLNADTTTIDRDDYLSTSFSTGLAAGNLGVESVAYDPVRHLFYFTTEKAYLGAWNLWKMDATTGAVTSVFDILNGDVGLLVTDISDIYYDRNSEHVFILSDESKMVVETNLSGVVLNDIAITGFTQPEGLTFNSNMSIMWVGGEPKQFARYDAEVTDCVTGNDSVSTAWDGDLTQIADGTCAWGFAIGTKSYRGYNTSAFVLLDHCEDDGTPVYRLQVVVKTDSGIEVLWDGTARNTPVGTYEREDSITCGPLAVDVLGCECDDELPTLTFDPPSGSSVSFPTNVFITSSDESAIVYYTTDGSDPTNNSAIYTGPVSLLGGEVIRARAYTTNCVGDIYDARYSAVEGFALDFICDTVDRAGVFDVFAANGSPDYHWVLRWAFGASKEVKRLEIYETNSQGVWITGQAWATQNPIYPAGHVGPFSVFPLVIDDGAQLNSAYAASLGTFTSATRVWEMFGQPFIPLTGYFKLLFVIDDGVGGETIIYKLIPHDCYYATDYLADDADPPANPLSTNILNLNLAGEPKSGAAAVGVAGDYWNTLDIEVDESDPAGVDMKWSNGTQAGFAVLQEHESGGSTLIFDEIFETTNADPMMKQGWRIKNDGWTRKLHFSDMPRGRYDVYVYGHGTDNTNILTCRVTTPMRSTGWEATAVGSFWNGSFVEGTNYVKFENVEWSAIEETDLFIEFATNQFSYVQGVQLVKKS